MYKAVFMLLLPSMCIHTMNKLNNNKNYDVNNANMFMYIFLEIRPFLKKLAFNFILQQKIPKMETLRRQVVQNGKKVKLKQRN